MKLFDFTLHHHDSRKFTPKNLFGKCISKIPPYENGTQSKSFGNARRNHQIESRYMLVCCAHVGENPLYSINLWIENLLKGTARSRIFPVVQIWKMCIHECRLCVHIIFLSKWLDQNQTKWDWFFVYLLLLFTFYFLLAVGWKLTSTNRRGCSIRNNTACINTNIVR